MNTNKLTISLPWHLETKAWKTPRTKTSCRIRLICNTYPVRSNSNNRTIWTTSSCSLELTSKRESHHLSKSIVMPTNAQTLFPIKKRSLFKINSRAWTPVYRTNCNSNTTSIARFRTSSKAKKMIRIGLAESFNTTNTKSPIGAEHILEPSILQGKTLKAMLTYSLYNMSL